MRLVHVKVSGQANFPAGKGIQAIINIRPFDGGYVNSLDATLPCDSTSWCDYAIAFRANEAQTNANPPYIMFRVLLPHARTRPHAH